MQTKRINIVLSLLLLAVVACGSACSINRINAQSAPNPYNAAAAHNTAETSPSYKPPKRVSRDVINTDKKASKKNKTK